MSARTLSWVRLALARLRPRGFRVRDRLQAALDRLPFDRGADSLRPGELPDPDELLAGAPARAVPPDEARRTLALSDALGARVVVPGDPAYPPPLLVSDDPPAALFLRGEPAALVGAGVAVVGSRRVTPGARGWARSLGRLAVAGGRGLVSGLTSAVEREALRGARAGRGGAPVLCVHPHPPEEGLGGIGREELEEVLAAGGALVTRLPPGAGAVRGRYQARNHLVAILCQELVVVQARAGSGVLEIAQHALEAGRRLRVARVDPASPLAAGGQGLVADGAEELLRPLDLVDPGGRLGGLLPAPVRYLESAGPVAPDRLAARLGLSPSRAEVRIEELLRRGWLAWTGDGRLAASYAPLLPLP